MEEWLRLPLGMLRGVVMVIGASDSGKSTLVRWLARELAAQGRRGAMLDGDIGQTELGVPGTMTLILPGGGGKGACFFVGSTSPRGHMLPVIVGLRRLLDLSEEAGSEVTVVDTSGMVKGQAGATFKEWKIQMARPSSVIAVQQGEELEPILRPLRREDFLNVHVLPVSPRVRARTPVEREEHRRRMFREGFTGFATRRIDIAGLPLYGEESAARGALLGLLDGRGLCLSAGVLSDPDPDHWIVASPGFPLDRLRGIRVGTVRIDPATGVEI
jgi:polynucleotide 5'-hydroxyl-kinase GRC3/NOL9